MAGIGNPENPYAPPYADTPRSECRPRSWLFAKLFAALAFFPGGYAGFHLALPPPPAPGEYQCGLAVLPAMFLGAPLGAIGSFFAAALVGSIVDRYRYRRSRTPDRDQSAQGPWNGNKTIVSPADEQRFASRLREMLDAGMPLGDAIRKMHREEKSGLLWLSHAVQNVAGLDPHEAKRIVIRETGTIARPNES